MVSDGVLRAILATLVSWAFVAGAPVGQAAASTGCSDQVTGATHLVDVGNGGARFTDETSSTSTTTLPVGDSVEWTWAHNSGLSHSSREDDIPLWDSDISSATSATCTHTFNSAGEFRYHCAVHGSAMTGRVIVGKVFDFHVTNVSVNESGVARVQVDRLGDSAGSVSVEAATSDGTAHQPGDYTSNDQVLMFGDGVTTQNFDVAIVDDSQQESNETVNLILSQPNGGVLGSAHSATLTIIDDDAPPQTFVADGLIKRSTDHSFVGNDVYSATAAGEVRTARAGSGDAVVFVVKVQNDGNGDDSFTVGGPGGSSKFTVRYLAGSVNVTSQVVAGTYATASLGPGASALLKIVVSVRKAASAGDVKRTLVTVTSGGDATARDAVKAVVKATV